MTKTIVVCSLCLAAFSSVLYAQNGGTAVPFLLYAPSPEIAAMANAGVALPNYNAMNFHANPALLGWSARSSNIAICLPSDLALFGDVIGSVFQRSIGTRVGYNTDSLGLPMSFGIGVMRQEINLGTFIRTDDSGRVVGQYTSKEDATSLGIGASYHWSSLEVALGVAVKPVSSYLRPGVGTFITPVESKSTATDVGIFVNYSPLSDIPIGIFHAFARASAGYTIANIGAKMEYRSEEDPLPRVERLGYALQAGTEVEFKGKHIPFLRLDWSTEAEHSLVYRDDSRSEYTALFSNLNVIDNVLLLKPNQFTDVRYGFRLNLLDIFGYSIGHSEIEKPQPADPVPASFVPSYATSSHGYSLQLCGIIRIINLFTQNRVLGFMANHIDVQYHQSTTSLFTNTQRSFSSISLLVNNIRL